jgi:hypothetical protein
MGAHPDEHRPGCPNDDLDGDGVPNEQDRCPSEPQGSAPDPSRPGCPLPDRDHDGVADANDACPDESAAPGASPEQSGCPELDHDHDGVLDEHDRCPDQPETINGFQDDDGCPEAHPPASARPLVRIVHAHPGDVGAPELLVPIQFTARDQLDHASEGAVAQLALALVATSRRPSRYHQVTVALTPPSAHGPAAVDAARATRRRDALVTALRAHGAPEWAVRGIAPMAPPPHSRPSGIILETVDHIPTAASAAPASAPSSVPASAASSAPSTGSPSPSPAPATR